ncbi:hypothetical protein IMSAG025_00643 [Muribaculaceae bacterium]|nr:hypothetical protein IMSAG025_00643 [Muribaculaceae bacterium]
MSHASGRESFAFLTSASNVEEKEIPLLFSLFGHMLIFLGLDAKASSFFSNLSVSHPSSVNMA